MQAIAISPIEEAFRLSALSAIEFYQRRISPWKGFKCPHRILHGGLSCSAHTKELLIQMHGAGISTMLAHSIERFRACNLAADILDQQRGGAPRVRCFVLPCCLPF